MRISDWSSDVCSSDLIQFIAYKSADRLPRIDSGADALAVDREFDAAHADNASMMLRDTVAACVLASNGSGSTPASRRSSSKAARMSDRISAFHADTDATNAPTRVSRIGVLAAQPRTHRAGCESWINVTASEWENFPDRKSTILNSS